DILTPERLSKMVTIDAARALGVDGTLGSLEAGKRADITVIEGSGDPYQALLAAKPQNVKLVLVDGNVLYGDSAFDALGHNQPARETLSVCSVDKFLCIAETSATDQLNQTYAQVKQVLESALSDYDTTVMPQGIAPFSPLAPLFKCN